MNKKVCFLIIWFLAFCVVACHLIEKRNSARKSRLEGLEYTFTECLPDTKPFKEFVKNTGLKDPFSQYFLISLL